MLLTNRHLFSLVSAGSAWLEQPPDEWETNESYQSLKAFGTSMKVINNDVTKRGIGMLQSISQSVRDLAQLQWLLQAVEYHRA